MERFLYVNGLRRERVKIDIYKSISICLLSV